MTKRSERGGQRDDENSTVDAVTPLAALILQAMQDFERRTGVELTQSDIARRGGIDKRQLSNYLRHPLRTPLTAERVKALAKGLGVDEARVTYAMLRTAGFDLRANEDRPAMGDRKIG